MDNKNIQIVSIRDYLYTDKLNDFDCDVDGLDDFLKDDAYRYEIAFKSCTQLIIDKNSKDIIGFYTSSIKELELSSKLDSKYYDDFTNGLSDDITLKTSIYVYFLNDLAIDRSFQNNGYGTGILKAIFKDSVKAYTNNHICIGGIMLESLKEATKFYSDAGFSFLHGYENALNENIKLFPMFISMDEIISLI